MSRTDLADRTVLVTGATGMVGSALAAELVKRRAAVVALVRDVDPRSEFYRSGTYRHTRIVNGPLEDFRTLERALAENEVDVVFHLGAQTLVTTALRAPMQTFESNVRGTYNLLEACRQLRGGIAAIVIASSDKAYGALEGASYKEDDPLAGRGPYDVSKSCADLIAQAYYHTFDLPVVISRCGNIYGPGDLNWDRIVPGTIRWALRSERPILRSDGKYIRDYIYLADAVEAYLTLAEQVGLPGVVGQAFNFSPETHLTVLEIVELILELTGKTDLTPIIRDTARAEIREQTLDASKAADVLGWRCKVDLREGLRQTIRWYEAFLAEGG